MSMAHFWSIRFSLFDIGYWDYKKAIIDVCFTSALGSYSIEIERSKPCYKGQ